MVVVFRKNAEVAQISLPVENNTIKGINRDFYQLLEANNHGIGYFDPGWLIIREEEDGSLAVQKNDLTFYISAIAIYKLKILKPLLIILFLFGYLIIAGKMIFMWQLVIMV